MGLHTSINILPALEGVEDTPMAKMTVPGSAETAAKWAEQTPLRSGYYESGTVGAGGTWETNTKGASKTFKAAIQAADIDKRFEGGVRRAGAAKFDRKVKDVGVDRFGPGVAAAQPDMQAGIDPYLAALAAMTIPARGARGSVGNYKIVQDIGVALNKKRLALLGAGSPSPAA